MRSQKPRLHLIAVLILLVTPASEAMDMPHYDIDSLVLMSTDIVVAKITQDREHIFPSATEILYPSHSFTATITEALYGSLHSNDRLDKLTPFLTFFQPMEDGMKVVLFLDRGPHQYDFIHSDAANSPFAIPPSGVYFIDRYDHVHEYFQRNNPGPYVAQGYMYFPEKTIPTKEQDLALPSLAEIRKRIEVAINTVRRIRPLLDRLAAIEDAPALMSLADTTSNSEKDCALRMATAINERAIEQIRSLNAPELLLRAYAVANISDSIIHAVPFIEPVNSTSPKEFEATRVRYLIDSFANRNQPVALRVAAIQILLNVSKFHSEPHNGPSQSVPIDNEWLINFAEGIQAASKAIFDDASQNPKLRGLCLQFLPIDHPETIADIRRVYKRTRSQELRFAIEKSFLAVSDALYGSLNPPGGPVSSRISEVRENGCAKKTNQGIAFLMEYRERNDFPLGQIPLPALTNVGTAQHLALKNIVELGGWRGTHEGESEFKLGNLTEIPAGRYVLKLEYSSDEKVLSAGYGIELAIRETPKGNEISLMDSTKH